MTIQLFGVNMKNPVPYAKAAIAWFAFIGLSFSFMSFKAANAADASTAVKDSMVAGKNDFKDLLSAKTAAVSTISLLQAYPQAASFIEKYAEKEGKHYERMKPKAQPHFATYDKILSSYGLPLELKYLSVIESNLNNNAVSPVGAAGPWQFMAPDAREFGLKVNGRVDERKDLEKSTHAAAKYLKQMYARFGDWLLVVASYNCGPNKVGRIMEKTGGKTFWDIQQHLPLETRNHVKKYISLQYIFEGDTIPASTQVSETLNG
ncbi:MAG: transglycosylase protein [Chitinophagaceae bacterium]|jgi:membrane-bound lytic murein transglycosylase D|nr:transglycosylase protein [Chitinophagaceae bacterium]